MQHFLDKLALPQSRWASAGAVAAAGVGAAALALLVARALLRAPDGAAHAYDDQRALSAAPHVVGGVRSSVLPSAGSALDAAVETLAAGSVHDPMHVACTSVVRHTRRRPPPRRRLRPGPPLARALARVRMLPPSARPFPVHRRAWRRSGASSRSAGCELLWLR